MAPSADPAVALDWFDRPTASSPGTFNLCYNALDRHVVRGRADEPALLNPFAPAGARTSFSYAELLERVAQLGGGFRELGVQPGDTVVLALPLSPELLIGVLACARVGAVAVPVPDDSPAAVRHLGLDEAVGHPAVVVVTGPRKAAVDAELVAAGRSAVYQVVLDAEVGAMDPSLGDIGFGVVMRPGAFQPAICAELDPASPLLVRLGHAEGPDPTSTYAHDWAFDLGAQAVAAGWAPGTYVTPADDLSPAAPYAALVGPLLVGATVELR